MLVTVSVLGSATTLLSLENGRGFSVDGVVRVKTVPVESGKIVVHLPGGEQITAPILKGTFRFAALPEGRWLIAITGSEVPETYGKPEVTGLSLNVLEGDRKEVFELP